MQLRRQVVAVVMMVGLMFAQAVAMGHACPLLLPKADAPMPLALSDQAPMPPDCAGMSGSPDPTSTANACASHCAAGQQIDVEPAAMVAPIGPQPALTIRLAESGIPGLRLAIWLSSLNAAPPRSLLFGRFLI